MFKELDGVETRFEAINRDLQDPEIAGDQDRYKSLMKEFSDLEEIVLSYRKFKNLKRQIVCESGGGERVPVISDDQRLRYVT